MSRSELPKDWRIASLEDVADFINGYSFKSTDWDISGLPIIRIQNLNDGSKPFNRFSAEIDEKYRVRSGDVLISWSASLGAYFWEGGDAWLNQHIFKAVINENTIDRDFFFWVMKNRIDKIAESARGSTMKHVTRKTFINSTIPLPPLPEQRAIARALRAVQGAREARQREVALEREHKAALMEHLFTHGTRGEATKMTEIGEMPESWKVVTLGDRSFKPDYGYTASASKNPSGPKFLRITDIQEDHVNWDSVPYCDKCQDIEENYKLKSGDLVIARIGATTGKIYLIHNCPDAIFASYLIRVRTRPGLSPDFQSCLIEKYIM